MAPAVCGSGPQSSARILKHRHQRIVMDKKQSQLGMNPSTASHRLVKDILYSLVKQTGQNTCYQCGFPMTRETFSIEHKVPWIDSDNPVELYFNLDNISFSHLSCNAAAKRNTRPKPVCGTVSSYSTGCRCSDCLVAWREYKRTNYKPEERSERYKRTGN